MSTLYVLNTLIGIINSRKNKLNPTGPMPGAAASSGPTQTNPTLPINPATSPANQNPANPSQSDWTSATAFQENASNTPLSPNPDGSKNPALLQPTGASRPSPMSPTQNGPQTEESFRQQLQQSDIYDLSGEKAAADALKREDAFKQQSLDQKAQQTKEFFAEQDRKQQETLQDVQKQADQQLQQKSEKEFWDQKQQTEMQAGMDKELRGLHEAAKQAHQEWRNDFTQGICRDDVAALYNKDITDRVGQYKERLDDLGANSVDAVQTIEKYKVKLQDEAAPQIEQKTGELHQEHFPEYSSAGEYIEGHGPDGHGSGHPPEHPPEPEPPENHFEEEGGKVGKTGPGITFPEGGPRADMPGLGGRESIRKGPTVPQEAQGGGEGQGEAPPPGVDQSKFAGPYASKSEPGIEQSKGPEDSKFLNPNPEGNIARITEEINKRKETGEDAASQAKEVTQKYVEHATGKAEKGPIDPFAEQPTQASQVADWAPHPHPLTDGSMAGPMMDSAKEFGEDIKGSWQNLKDNMKVSSPEALDKLADETKSSLESDQNKVIQETEFKDPRRILPQEPQTAPATSMVHEIEGGATFGKAGGLSGQDAELVRLFAERQNDLGKSDQGVQEFAGQLKTMEAQAPAPAAPAPEVKTAAPDDFPIAWGGGNMGVVGRVERGAKSEPSGREVPDPPEPAQSAALPAPAPEVQTAVPPPVPAPAPTPAPAPQQPGPSLSPSL